MAAECVCCTCKAQCVTETCVVVVVRSTDKRPRVFRCKRCHDLRSRIERLQNGHGNLVEDWRKLSQEEKDAFISSNQELAGPNLVAKLSETIIMRKRVSSKVNFGGHGDYLSEHDLELKYKDQPDVAKAIVKNGRKMFDPVKELWLYEDVSYKSKFEDEECIEEDRRTHLDFEARQAESSAPTPQSQPRGGGKRESVGDAAAGPDPKKKKNNAALHKKMQKYLGMIAPVKLELQSYLTKASAGEMAKFVPAYVVSHAAALQDKVDALWTNVQAFLNGEECHDEGRMQDDVKSALSECTSAIARLKVQLSEADDFCGDSASRASGSTA